MKEITAYLTEDGNKFFNKEEALKHEEKYLYMIRNINEKMLIFNYFRKKISEYGFDNSSRQSFAISNYLLFFLVLIKPELKKFFDDFTICNYGVISDGLSLHRFKDTEYVGNIDELKPVIDDGIYTLNLLNPDIFKLNIVHISFLMCGFKDIKYILQYNQENVGKIHCNVNIDSILSLGDYEIKRLIGREIPNTILL